MTYIENLYNANTNLVFGNNTSPYSFCKIFEYIIECFCIERGLGEFNGYLYGF